MGFFVYLTQINVICFPRRDLDGNELKKLLPGLFSNLVSLQTLWVNDVPYYRKLTLHELNANFNDSR